MKIETIPFNKTPCTGNELAFVQDAIERATLAGDGFYSKKCQQWFKDSLSCINAVLTPSCTAALEMAAMLINVQPGDEIIMPSYTFVSTANAFVLRGAKIVFVDIRPDTMNIDEKLIKQAITNKTKAIVPVHYAGVACEMDTIMAIAESHSLYVIEDAAQGMMATYKGKPLGTIGHLGAYSFHATKNYTSGGEGGLLIVNDARFAERAEVIREKGTNRSRFLRGQVDKYTWVDVGSSYLPSELQAAYLWGQISKRDVINENRLVTWNAYRTALLDLNNAGKVELPSVPEECSHNAHMFYLKVADLDARTDLLSYLRREGVAAAFHYVPLHSSPAGLRFGRFNGEDRFTTSDSERLLRLPLWYGVPREAQTRAVSAVIEFLNDT